MRRRSVRWIMLFAAILCANCSDDEPPPIDPPGEPVPARVSVQIMIYDGFEISDALMPFDVLKIAGHLGADIETNLVTTNNAAEVTSLDGVVVKPTATLDLAGDILVIPGSGPRWPTLRPPGLSDVLLQWKSNGKILAGVCTGTMFVAREGLLEGRHAITHRSAIPALAEAGAMVVNARVVDDGDVITSAGVTSGLDFALHLIERYAGSQLALQTEQVLEYDRRGVVWRRDAN